ncbi:MAG TPA: hypothetical protein VFM77_01270 [Terriglobales bacterium]|nr:hypothetical protein [Terriglobales bacterium]
MIKEYKVTIQSYGENKDEAVENAVRMLNLGATFDEVEFLWEEPQQFQKAQ